VLASSPSSSIDPFHRIQQVEVTLSGYLPCLHLREIPGCRLMSWRTVTRAATIWQLSPARLRGLSPKSISVRAITGIHWSPQLVRHVCQIRLEPGRLQGLVSSYRSSTAMLRGSCESDSSDECIPVRTPGFPWAISSATVAKRQRDEQSLAPTPRRPVPIARRTTPVSSYYGKPLSWLKKWQGKARAKCPVSSPLSEAGRSPQRFNPQGLCFSTVPSKRRVQI